MRSLVFFGILFVLVAANPFSITKRAVLIKEPNDLKQRSETIKEAVEALADGAQPSSITVQTVSVNFERAEKIESVEEQAHQRVRRSRPPFKLFSPDQVAAPMPDEYYITRPLD